MLCAFRANWKNACDDNRTTEKRYPGVVGKEHAHGDPEGAAIVSFAPSSHLSDKEWQAIADSLRLTVRQREIVECVFDGLDEAAIAERLGVSGHTVHTHLNRLYKRLGVNCRSDLVVSVFIAHFCNTSATG